MLNNNFSKSFVNDNHVIKDIFSIRPPEGGLGSMTFPCAMVSMYLRKLNNSKTIGPDGLSSFAIKNIGECLVTPLSSLFEFLFMNSHVPADWKKAVITPLYKKGPSSNPANYRPISITCVLCRLTERIINHQMASYFVNGNLLSIHQHGFLRCKSTITHLLECTSSWITDLDNLPVLM